MKTFFHYMLALGMLITGSLNTITTKAADNVWTLDRFGDSVQFNHPFFQALCMFLGEFLCLIVFNALRLRAKQTNAKFDEAKPHSKFIFALPALCDMTATSLMYVGLTLTDASIFQMLRGSVVIFTGILTTLVFKRKLGWHRWLAMFLVAIGTGVVGVASLPSVCPSNTSSSSSTSNPTLGNILVIVAQAIVAVQMIVEEVYIGKYDIPPLQVVGWEGTFGFATLSIVLGIMYVVPAPAAFCANSPHCDHFEDTYDAIVNIKNSWQLGLALGGNILSIAFFNAIGVAITKHMNAATRMVLDSLRTMVIWFFSMGIGWEHFCWPKPVGFVVLLAGILIFNEVIKLPGFSYEVEGEAGKVADEEDGQAALLGDSGDGEYDIRGMSLNATPEKGKR